MTAARFVSMPSLSNDAPKIDEFGKIRDGRGMHSV
jgi:hypothetical protein